MGGTLSALYSILAGLHNSKVSQLFLVWQSDIPELAGDEWEEGIQQFIPLMISSHSLCSCIGSTTLQRGLPESTLIGDRPATYAVQRLGP